MVHGSCLCGGVRYEINGRLTPLQLCHCSLCRKASGSAFNAGLAAKRTAFRWVSGEDLIQRFATPSGYERTFCRVCGSPVPRDDEEEVYTSLPAGTLDDDPGSRPLRHIFVGSKAPWFQITDDLPRFAAHAPQKEQLPSKRDRTR
jgi:hypothetical protein